MTRPHFSRAPFVFPQHFPLFSLWHCVRIKIASFRNAKPIFTFIIFYQACKVTQTTIFCKFAKKSCLRYLAKWETKKLVLHFLGKYWEKKMAILTLCNPKDCISLIVNRRRFLAHSFLFPMNSTTTITTTNPLKKKKVGSWWRQNPICISKNE